MSSITDALTAPRPAVGNESTTLAMCDRALRFASTMLATCTASVAPTPKQVVWEHNQIKLYRYWPRRALRHPVPLLLVHSLIARPYVLDLVPGTSLVEYLLDEGYDVYLIDWDVPTARLRLEDYVLDYLPQALRIMRAESQAADVSMLGYCLGGTLVLLYAATHPDGPVRNIVSVATPVNFRPMVRASTCGSVPADPCCRIAIEPWVDGRGNIPAEVIRTQFQILRSLHPASEFSWYLSLWENLDDPEYVAYFRALDRWGQDHIPFPGEVFRQMTNDFGWGDKLIRGGFELGGRRAELRNIHQAFLAIAAESDILVPLAATDMQVDLVGSADKDFLTVPGGHVGLVAGRESRTTVWPRVAEWLAARSGTLATESGVVADELAAQSA
jgi:polyhydroxyalkanoate synthase subunit PhaC